MLPRMGGAADSAAARGTTRAAIYTRISHDTEGRGLGVARQEADCRAYSRARGWHTTHVFTDNDVSASRYTNRRRPQYDLLLQSITDGSVDAVVAYDLDRLVRRPVELEHFFHTCDAARVTLLATVSGDIRLDTEDGRFQARILGAVAAKEAGNTSSRIKAKHRQLREGGQYASGPRCFGWADLVTPHPVESPILVALCARVLAGESVRGLVRWLNAEELRTARGNIWRASTLRKLLANPRHAGLITHNGATVGAGTFPALITPAAHHRIVALFATRAGPRPRQHPLTGLLVCWKCDVPLTGHRLTYHCLVRGCGATTIGKHLVEPAVVEILAAAIDMDVFNRARVPSLAPLYAELDVLESRQVELARVWSAGGVSVDEWMAAREPLTRDVEQIRKNIARAEVVCEDVDARSVVARWGQMTVDQQARHLRAFFERIVVGPGRSSRFDPTRLQPVWRQ